MTTRTSVIVATTFVVLAGVLTFHPSRPLYTRSREIQVVSRDGTLLAATLALPRWHRSAVPAVVLVHGSGRLSRRHVIGDVRRLVRAGIGVLAYDKRGVGGSAGTYPTPSAAPDSVLRVLADDAAAVFDSLRVQRGVDSSRVGYFGASQASWIIPLAAQQSSALPRFQIILSGAAVSTGEEGFYSFLSGDGSRPPRVASATEIAQRTRAFAGEAGFDPRPLLRATQVPTLWLLGEQDQSVPTFRSAEVLDSLRTVGARSHTVIRYPQVGHDLRNVDSGHAAPIWTDMLAWLQSIRVN